MYSAHCRVRLSVKCREQSETVIAVCTVHIETVCRLHSAE